MEGIKNWKPSALGFGAMRLPTIDGESGKVDEEETTKMIRYAINNGVNYVDTAWPYHDQKSEIVVGKALKDGYREKVKLATKLPSWAIKDSDDLDKYLNKQLEKLEVDKIDFYLLHALMRDRWDNLQELDKDVFEWMQEKKEEGKIEYAGFSFHDNFEVFKEIIDTYEWDFCQIQYNYVDQEYQAGKKGLKYAASKGLGVIIMEPLRGGILANEPPKEMKEIWKESDRDWNPVEWALHWLWNQPEVSLVLSGMSKMNQVEENVEIASRSSINSLNEKDLEVINQAADKFKDISPVRCTGCNYCLPCPNNILIPLLFQIYNESELYDKYEEKKKRYDVFKENERAASDCVKCEECLEKCPQNLAIVGLLEEVADYFEE